MSLSNFWNTGSALNSSNNSNNLYGLFCDNAAIKNGSYKRLLRSYYGSPVKTSGSSASGKSDRSETVLDKLLREKKYPSVSEKTKEVNAKLTKGLNSLGSSVGKLQNESTFEDTENGTSAKDKVVSAVKDFVTSYNDVVTASKSSSMTSKTAYVANMMTATSKHENQLKEIGISLNRDGTLQLDQNKLKAADISKVKDLFSADNAQSYGSVIASRIRFAGTSSTGSVSGTTTDTDSKKDTGTSASALKADGETLASSELFAKIKDKDGEETFDVAKILSTAKSFVSNYNKMFDAAESSSNSGVVANLSYIREKTADSEDSLAKFGISVDKKGRLTLNEDTFKKADMAEVQKFFKNYGSYVASNASRVNYYMTTNANAANGYNARAGYNLPHTSDYTTSI